MPLARSTSTPRHSALGEVVRYFDRSRSTVSHADLVLAGAESRLGFRLPSLLRRLFVEVADGGFGPGYTGHTLGSWLGAWLDGVDLWKAMFEAGPARMGINPFTKQPIELKGQGKPRGTPWP